MDSVANIVNNIVITLVTDSNYTYGGDDFIMYKNMESLGGIPETNIILYFNYT